MGFLRQMWARLVAFCRKRERDEDLDQELASHIDLAAEDFIRRGVDPVEAMRMSRVKFGSMEASKDAQRDARGLPGLETFLYDLRFAIRGLRRDRGFAITAVAMLALAIGLNATVFTVMNAMLFRGYPVVKRNDRVVYLQESRPSGACCISYADFEDWRGQAKTFEALSFVREAAITFRDGEGRPIDMGISLVSSNMFRLLGVSPLLGRDFVLADETPGTAPVVILNYRFWVSRFGKRADIVGSTVHVNGAPATIIGVMPERFDFPTQVDEDVWLPVVRTPELLQRGSTEGAFLAAGRLRDGVSLPEARAELEAINRRLEAAYPTTNRRVVLTVATHSQSNSGSDAAMIWGSLWAAAWFVLLIACANLANLTLVRTRGRQREFSTMMALGAGQGRMARRMLAESLMLAGVAGMLGWWITSWSVRTWAEVTASRYQVLDYAVDSGTLAYLVAISIAAAILFALAPIGSVVRLSLSGALRADAGGVTQSPRDRRLAGALIAGQMALAIVLLSGAGVLLRSFVTVVSAETGVRDPEKILTGAMQLPSDAFPTPEGRRAYFHRLEAKLKAVPGVTNATVATSIPVAYAPTRAIDVEGRLGPADGQEAVQFNRATPDYFRVIGVAPIAGRGFNESDRAGAPQVVMVNKSFASRYWPGEQPLGKRLRVKTRTETGEWRTVVGIAANIMQGDALRQTFKPIVYVPFDQEPAPRHAYFFLRTAVPAGQVAQAVRGEIQSLDRNVALEDFKTLKESFAFNRDYMDAGHSELGKHAKVAPAFALIALLLAAVGMSAVIGHSVTQRTKEIGIRMAMGAKAGDVRRMVLGEGMAPVAAGMILGLVASLAVNRILQSQLVGVSPYDPVTLVAAAAVLILSALMGCQIPARRAIRVDPAVALRSE